MIEKLKQRAGALKAEAYAIYLAARDPRTPWYAKALIFFVVAHTFSPIDLVPDFIPVLGYLDDLVITPGGIWLAVRLIPPEVMQEARATAEAWAKSEHGRVLDRRVRMAGALLIILVWMIILSGAVCLFWRRQQ